MRIDTKIELRWRFFLAATLAALGACNSGGNNGGDSTPPPPPAPTVSLSAPSSGTVNRTVALTASATAASGVNQVEFLVDGTLIASDTTAPYGVDWDTATVSDGAHSLTARVVDSANVSATSAAVTVTVSNTPTIEIFASAAEVFPRTNSTATGTGELSFNLISGAVSGGVTLSAITATVAHIHAGIAGTNGPVIIDFLQSGSDPNRWDAEAGATLTADQIDALLAGELYVNVHSAAYPSGEIRGQIKPEGISVGLATLSGANVVSPIANMADGFAAMTLDSASNTATVHVHTSGVDDATEAHLHDAPVGENAAAPLYSLMKDPALPTHWSLEQQAITQADADALGSDRLYVDVHTPSAPDGALRGQLTLDADTPPPPPVVTLAELQSTIFTPSCSGCHTGGGASLPSSMNLSNAAATHAALVGVASTEQPTVLRVSAGDPDASYLVRKLEGAPGITGSRMPLGAAPLDAALIANVRAWITAGAANN